MTRNPRRTLLAAGYILHHRPYRDTSRILEAFTRDFGRISLFARGVRGSKSKLAPILQPFQPLLLSWSGRGEAPQLTGAEPSGVSLQMPASSVMAAFYLNELLLKLTTRHDPHPPLFDAYHRTVERLKQGEPLERTLRLFEKRLLEELGYGLELTTEAQTGQPIDPEAHYHFRPTHGLIRTVAEAPGALAGRSLVSLAEERLAGARELEDAKRLLQAALAHVLEGRELTTRAVARSVTRRESRT